MNTFQTDILSRRKHYRERRNTVRSFLLLLFSVLFISSMYLVLKIPNKKPITIELSKNYLVKNEYIIQNITKQLSANNFFFISPRSITKNLLLSCGMLKDIVIRKYLLPELKLVVFVKEKQLWGKFISPDNSKIFGSNLVYITDGGDLVSGNYLNFNLLPSNLVLVTCNNKLASESALLILKEAFDFFHNNLKIKVNNFFITDRNTLEIYTDNAIKISAGYVDANLMPKITKLGDILEQIKKKSYLIQYIDLSLDNGAVVKKIDKNNIDKK